MKSETTTHIEDGYLIITTVSKISLNSAISEVKRANLSRKETKAAKAPLTHEEKVAACHERRLEFFAKIDSYALNNPDKYPIGLYRTFKDYWGQGDIKMLMDARRDQNNGVFSIPMSLKNSWQGLKEKNPAKVNELWKEHEDFKSKSTLFNT